MTARDAIKQVMCDVLAVDIEDIFDDSSPDNMPKWDSLSHLKLIIALEAELDIQLTPEDAMDMLSFKLIQIIVEEKME